MGEDRLHAWAINRRRSFELQAHTIWLAPPEYVIIRKLEFYREGGSGKHLQDVRGILAVSPDQIDLPLLEVKLAEAGLMPEWRKWIQL